MRTVVGSFVAEVVAIASSEEGHVVVKEGFAKKRFGKEQPVKMGETTRKEDSGKMRHARHPNVTEMTMKLKGDSGRWPQRDSGGWQEMRAGHAHEIVPLELVQEQLPQEAG